MKNNLVIYSICGLLLSLTSCQDFLEPKSQSEFVPKDVQSLNELLIGDVYMGPDNGNMFGVLGVFDDDVAITEGLSYGSFDEVKIEQVKLSYSWDNDMLTKSYAYDIYGVCYQRIMGCNAVLDYIDEISGLTEEKAWVKAQALSMRAFYYYYLINLYAKPYSLDKNALGVPLKINSSLSTVGIPRSTVGAVYNRMEHDLLEAERLFLNVSGEYQWNKNGYKASLPMAQLLLSRIYLYMEEWEMAVTYGEKVINNPNFHLLDLNTIPEPTPTLSEPYFDYQSVKNPEMIFLHGALADMLTLSAKSVRGENGKVFPICCPSESLFRSYKENDLRASRYIVQTAQAYGFVPGYWAVGKIKTGGGYIFNVVYGQDWGISIRLSEAYLNAIEGAAMIYKLKGDATYYTKAVQWLDDFRKTRFDEVYYTKETGTNADFLVDFVRNERRCELCFEHHRWFDLRRYGMKAIEHRWETATETVVYKLEENDPGYTLLIPNSAFEMNGKLVQNERRTNRKD